MEGTGLGDIVSNKPRWVEFFNRYYRDEINILSLGQVAKPKSLNIDYIKVIGYDVRLADELLNNPVKMIKDAEDALFLIVPATGKKVKAYARVVNLPRKLLVKDLGEPDRINTMVSIDGNVRKIAGIHPRLVVGAFECVDRKSVV